MHDKCFLIIKLDWYSLKKMSTNKHVKYLKTPSWQKLYDIDYKIRWFYCTTQAFGLIKDLVYEYFIHSGILSVQSLKSFICHPGTKVSSF